MARQLTEMTTKSEQIGLKVAFWYSNKTAALRPPQNVHEFVSGPEQGENRSYFDTFRKE